MKKKIYIALLVIILAIAGVVFYLFTNMESIVKQLVHKYGSEITGTDVDIDGFHLSLKNGEGRVSKITVSNPKGYATPYLFTLEDITIKVNLKSLTTDTIIIEKIFVDTPVVTYEMLSLVQNNISEIQKNAENFSKKSAANKKPEDPKKAKKNDKPGKKVIIKNLTIDSGELHVATKLTKKDSTVDIKLPKIVLTNIGETKSKDGASVADVITTVINKILSTASQTVVSSGIGNLKDVAQENLDNVVGSVKERVNVKGLFGK